LHEDWLPNAGSKREVFLLIFRERVGRDILSGRPLEFASCLRAKGRNLESVADLGRWLVAAAMVRFALRGGVGLFRISSAVLLLLIAPCHGASPDNSDTSTVTQQAKRAEAAGDSNAAVTLYANGLKRNPAWTDGWWEYGGLLYRNHRFGEAAQAFGRLTRLAPANPLGFALLGLCEYEQGDWNNSGLHLSKALASGPGMPPEISHASAYHLGLVQLHEERADRALPVFEHLFRQAPDYPGLPMALGAAELHLSGVPDTDSPLFPAVQMAAKAAVAVLEDRKNDAGEAYRALHLQFPAQPFVHLHYGVLLMKQNRVEAAAEEFRAETKLNPNDGAAWIWLARLAVERLDAPEARADAAKARALDPQDGLSYYIEGRSFMIERRWENALEALREAEKRAPDNSEVHFSLASVYAAMHRSDDAAQERKLFLTASKSSNQAPN
jgi:tetratricopeptide (TPR) repeat protein